MSQPRVARAAEWWSLDLQCPQCNTPIFIMHSRYTPWPGFCYGCFEMLYVWPDGRCEMGGLDTGAMLDCESESGD